MATTLSRENRKNDEDGAVGAAAPVIAGVQWPISDPPVEYLFFRKGWPGKNSRM